MANTSIETSSTSSLIPTPSSTPYLAESYNFNYTNITNQSNDFLADVNYTDLWVDVWNVTVPQNITEKLNATVETSSAYCDEWETAQHKLFQAANFFFAAAFLVPRSFKASVLALRTFLTAGFMLAALWAGMTICSLDTMLWCLALGLLNGIHSLILACKFLPPALSPELADLYLKFFKPFKVSKKHFQELAKEARIYNLDSGQTYATESITPGDERLSILLRGKLKVSCDNTHLHFIRAYQFVDSPEWEATHDNLDNVFQVTIRADENSTYICWTRLKLLRILRHRPLLKIVINALIGKDITTKLYALNEHLAGVSAARVNSAENPYRGVARSASVDAVNTETAGKIRSSIWQSHKKQTTTRDDGRVGPKSSPMRSSNQYWAPVLVNHFPAKSPFAPSAQFEYPGNAGYSLLPTNVQFSPPPHVAATPPPLTRQRSGGPGGDYTLLPQTPKFERKSSKKRLQENI